MKNYKIKITRLHNSFYDIEAISSDSPDFHDNIAKCMNERIQAHTTEYQEADIVNVEFEEIPTGMNVAPPLEDTMVPDEEIKPPTYICNLTDVLELHKCMYTKIAYIVNTQTTEVFPEFKTVDSTNKVKYTHMNQLDIYVDTSVKSNKFKELCEKLDLAP